MRAPIVLLAASLLVVGSAAEAQSITQEQSAVAQARQDADAALRRAAAFSRQAADARSAAVRAAAERAAVAARLASSEAAVRASQARVTLVAAERRRQARALADAQAPAERLAAALETLARRPPALALVQPGSVADLVHVRMLFAATLPAIRQRSAGLRHALVRSDQLRREAILSALSLTRERAELARRRTELARLEQGQRSAARRFTDESIGEQERAAALGEHARDLVDLMEEQGREAEVRGRLADLAGPLPRPDVPGLPAVAPPPIGAKFGYRLPVAGTLVSGLGELFESGVRSKGLTLATAADAAVIAPAAGKIAFAGPFRHYGEIVILDHGEGWATLVTGLAHADVHVGDRLDPGDALGTAPAGEPRVTVELRRRDQAIDLTRLLPD